MTPAKTLAASKLVTRGKAYRLGIETNKDTPPSPPRTFSITVVQPGQAAGTTLGPTKTYNDVNGERLNAHLRELAQFWKTLEGGTHRLYGRRPASPPVCDEADARAKLEVSIDAAGNIVGRRDGSDTALKPLMIGSHIDSVPAGGSYDGQVGSMGAIEVLIWQELFIAI